MRYGATLLKPPAGQTSTEITRANPESQDDAIILIPGEPGSNNKILRTTAHFTGILALHKQPHSSIILQTQQHHGVLNISILNRKDRLHSRWLREENPLKRVYPRSRIVTGIFVTVPMTQL